MPDEKKDQTSDKQKEESTPKKTKKQNGIAQLFVESIKDKWILRLAVLFFFDAVIWSIGGGVYFAGLLDEKLLGNYHLTDETLSILMLTFNITVLVFQYPAGWITDRVGAKIILVIAEILGILWAVTTVLFVFFPQYYWIVILSRIILGFHVSFWIPSSVVITTSVPTEKKSRVYNALAIYRTIGFIPGGFVAGYLYEAITLPYGYVTSFFILIAGLVILTPIFLTVSNTYPEGKKEVENTIKKEK